MREPMKTIKSFQVDHTKLQKGLYLSRVDGDCVTYDIRMCTPNGGIYLQNAGLHTFEHLFATYVRNSAHSDEVVYVGPMGCRTGFYFIARDSMSRQQVLDLLRETFLFISEFVGQIPGASKPECGNYLDHDLNQAKAYARTICQVLEGWTPERMDYEG